MKAVVCDHTGTREIEYESPLGDMMAKCYAQLSAGQDTEVEIPAQLDALFDPLEKALNIHIGRRYRTVDVPRVQADDTTVLIAYSSGLDSTSHALYWRTQKKNVVLFHVKNLNRSYPDEFKAALRFATDFRFPIVVIEPKFARQTAYVDNPIKNQTVLAYMADYGRAIGCSHYGMGNYRTDKLMEQVQGYWTTDSIELYDAINSYMRTLMPSYVYHHMPFNKYGAFQFMVRHYPQAVAYVNSCLRPHRFKDYTHDQTVRKYGVPIIAHHCGVCYKCALEYLMLADMGYYRMNAPYAKKCIDTMRAQDGSTFTMGIKKDDGARAVLEKVLGRPATSRWDTVTEA